MPIETSPHQAVARTTSRRQLPLGILFALLYALGLALVNAFAKAAQNSTSSTFIVLAQFAIAFGAVALFHLVKRVRIGRPGHLGLYLIRALAGVIGFVAVFEAIRMSSLSEAVLLSYSAPILLPFLAAVLLGEAISRAVVVGALIGFAGVFLVLNPTGGEVLALGPALAMVAALAIAITLLVIERLGRDEPSHRYLLIYFGLGALLMLPVAAVDWDPPGPAIDWVFLLACGASQILAQAFAILAYRMAPAVVLGPMIYFVVIFVALIDHLVWRQAFPPADVVGALLVIAGGALAIVARARLKAGAASVDR